MVAVTTTVLSASNSASAVCAHGSSTLCPVCSSFVGTTTNSTTTSSTACIHGIYYGNYCSLCNSTGGGGITVGYCTCNTYSSYPCPLHSYQSVPISAPSFTTWPPSPTIPVVELCKDGHTVTHELIADEKGLKVVFTCTHCKEPLFKKYIVKIPRSLREEKCLNRVLKGKE